MRFIRAQVLSGMAPWTSRASAATRLLAFELGRVDPFDCVEAVVEVGDDADGSEWLPGMVLLHRSLPLWLAIVDDSVWLGVATDLAHGRVAPQLASVRRVLRCLTDAGFLSWQDLKTGAWLPIDRGAADLLEHLTAAGGRGHLGRIAGGVVAATIAIGAAVLSISRLLGPQWTFTRRGLAFALLGIAAVAVHGGWRWRTLRARIADIRRDVIQGFGSLDRLAFRLPGYLGFIAILGTGWWILFAVAVARDPSLQWLVVVFSIFAVITAGTAVFVFRHRITLHPDFLEVRNVFTTRVRYETIEGTWWVERRMRFVLESPSGFMKISAVHVLGKYRLFWEELWLRVEAACRRAVASKADRDDGSSVDVDRLVLSPAECAEMLQGTREILGRSSKPLLLRSRPRERRWYRRRDDQPLRTDWSLVWGYVVAGASGFPPHGQDRNALVLYSEEARFHGDLGALGEVADAVARDLQESGERGELQELVASIGRSWDGVDASNIAEAYAGFRCVLVPIVAREIPLGYVRSPWLPLIVWHGEPGAACVLTRWFWSAPMKLAWKAGARPIQEGTS